MSVGPSDPQRSMVAFDACGQLASAASALHTFRSSPRRIAADATPRTVMKRNARCVSTRSMSSALKHRAKHGRVVRPQPSPPDALFDDPQIRVRKRSRHACQERASLRAARAIRDRVREKGVRQTIELQQSIWLPVCCRYDGQRAAASLRERLTSERQHAGTVGNPSVVHVRLQPAECANPPAGNPESINCHSK